MKNKTLQIWWVDDEAERLRSRAIKRIQEGGGASVKARWRAKVWLLCLKDQTGRIEFEKEMDRAKRNKKLPHLIVLDQNLNIADGLRGSSFAVSIRAEIPSVPIVGVTAVELEKIADLQREQFIELFSLDGLQSGDRIPDLFSIATGFAKVASSYRRTTNPSERTGQILQWLDCPKDDSDFLSKCLPGEFIDEWDDETGHSFARWVWHTFAGRPGFLSDDLEIATVLGLKESGLMRLETKLNGCDYRGVFSSSARRRWWVSKVRRAVRELTKASATEPLWKLGRQLIGDQYVRDFSRCHGRSPKGCVPDVVAFSDDTLRDPIQARMQDTKPLDTDTPPFGFEQRRVFWKG